MGSPTEKTNAPLTRWPSTVETFFQATVYVPSASGSTDTDIRSGSDESYRAVLSVHAVAPRVEHLDLAERRLKRLGEPDRDALRRLLNHRVGSRVGLRVVGVCLHLLGAQVRHKQNRQGQDDPDCRKSSH